MSEFFYSEDYYFKKILYSIYSTELQEFNKFINIDIQSYNYYKFNDIYNKLKDVNFENNDTIFLKNEILKNKNNSDNIYSCKINNLEDELKKIYDYNRKKKSFQIYSNSNAYEFFINYCNKINNKREYKNDLKSLFYLRHCFIFGENIAKSFIKYDDFVDIKLEEINETDFDFFN